MKVKNINQYQYKSIKQSEVQIYKKASTKAGVIMPKLFTAIGENSTVTKNVVFITGILLCSRYGMEETLRVNSVPAAPFGIIFNNLFLTL